MPTINNSPYWESCDELFEDEGVTYDLNRSRPKTRKFLVVAKVKQMGPDAVALCPLLPQPGSFYANVSPSGEVLYFDELAILTHQSAARRSKDADQWPYWVVTCEYNTDFQTRTDTPSNNNNKPETDLADISWDVETVNEARQFDLNAKPYLNTANMPFAPAPTIPIDYPVLHIARNELTFNYAKSSFYTRALNDADFLGAPRGCVQCLPPAAVQKNKGVLRYWRTSYKFRFRHLQKDGTYVVKRASDEGGWVDWRPGPDPPHKLVKTLHYGDMPDSWQTTLLSQGKYRLGRGEPYDEFNVLGKWIPVVVHGHPVHNAVPLDHEGQPIIEPNDNGTLPAWFIRFEDFRYVDMKSLLVKGLS